MRTSLQKSLWVRQILIFSGRTSESHLQARLRVLAGLWKICRDAGFKEKLPDSNVPVCFPDVDQLKGDANANDRFWLHAYAKTKDQQSLAYVYEYDDVLALVIVQDTDLKPVQSPALFEIAAGDKQYILSDELFYAALSNQSDQDVAGQLNAGLSSILHQNAGFTAPSLPLLWGGRFFTPKLPSRLQAAIIGKLDDEVSLAEWAYLNTPGMPPPFLRHHIYRAKLAYHEAVFDGYWEEVRKARQDLDKGIDRLLPHLATEAASRTVSDSEVLLKAQRDSARLALWDSYLEALSVTFEISQSHLSDRAGVPKTELADQWFSDPIQRVTSLLAKLDDERSYSAVRRKRFEYLTALVQADHAERDQQQSEHANSVREFGAACLGALTLTLSLGEYLSKDPKMLVQSYYPALPITIATASFAIVYVAGRWKRHGWDRLNSFVSAVLLGTLEWLACTAHHFHPHGWTLLALLVPPISLAVTGWIFRHRKNRSKHKSNRKDRSESTIVGIQPNTPSVTRNPAQKYVDTLPATQNQAIQERHQNQ